MRRGVHRLPISDDEATNPTGILKTAGFSLAHLVRYAAPAPRAGCGGRLGFATEQTLTRAATHRPRRYPPAAAAFRSQRAADLRPAHV